MTQPPSDLASLRQSAGLSQDELAHALDVAKYTIQRWESGASRPGEATWNRIRQALQRRGP